MAPRQRLKQNRALPERWRFRYNAYYYQVPKGQEKHWDGKKEFRLGTTLAESYREWIKRMKFDPSETRTMNELMDRYMLEVVPDKATSTQTSNTLSIKRLRPVFGEMKIADRTETCLIKPKHAYKYYETSTKKYGKVSCKHDIQVLRHMLTKAVQWGIINENPLLNRQLQLPNNPPRDRLVEDWELSEALNLPGNSRGVVICRLYLRFKVMSGWRRTDILNIKYEHIRDDGIHCTPNKTKNTTGLRRILEWDDAGELRNLIEEIKAVPPFRYDREHLFVTRQGKPFLKNAFDSIWGRFMDRLIAETNISERFRDSDLRAKTSSESATLEEAADRLAHSDPATTNKVYRRKPKSVKPLVLDVLKKNKG